MKRSQPFSFSEILNAGTPPEVPVEYFASSDNIKLAYYHFKTSKPAIAAVVFIHGGGAHSKLGYTFLAQTLKNDFNIETFLLDLRGHGKSEGKRGDSPSLEMVFIDIKNLIKNIKANSHNPIYLAGHSSGAGAILNYSSWSKSEPVSGYFFISPDFGFRSKTSKEGEKPFAKVKTWKFISCAISGERFYQHDYTVFFNYPYQVLKQQPLIVPAITVNMAKALTPNNPVKQFMQLTEPFGLYIGENDELFNTKKVLEFGNLPKHKNPKTIIKLIKNVNHLSILINIGSEIGKTIKQWTWRESTQAFS